MLFTRVFAGFLLFFATHLSAAWGVQDNGGLTEAQRSIRVLVEQESALAMRLIVRQVASRHAINEIAKKTGIAIHYSALPEDPVTADCKGAIKRVLACLLGPNVDMVFRYSLALPKGLASTQPTEIWLLSVPVLLKSDQYPEDMDVGNETGQQQIKNAAETDNMDDTDTLLELAKDPLRRMDAIAGLAVEGRKDDLKVRLMLKEALADTNPGVRAQAVFALARREGNGALADIEQVMHDNNVDVRRMAVESAGNDAALLQQALQDKDAAIRQYAATKLALVNKSHQGE